jgi:hypothetical protein
VSVPVFSNCPTLIPDPQKVLEKFFNGFEVFGGRFLDFIKGRVFNCFLFFLGFLGFFFWLVGWCVCVCVCVCGFLKFKIKILFLMW